MSVWLAQRQVIDRWAGERKGCTAQMQAREDCFLLFVYAILHERWVCFAWCLGQSQADA